MYKSTAFCLIICQYFTEKYAECLETLCILIETRGLSQEILVLVMILALKLDECRELVDELISNYKITNEKFSLFLVGYKLYLKNVKKQDIDVMPYILTHMFKFGCSVGFCILAGFSGMGTAVFGSHMREVHYKHLTNALYYRGYINYYFWNIHLLIYHIHNQQLARHMKKYVLLFGYDSYTEKIGFLYELCCFNLNIKPLVNLIRNKDPNTDFLDYVQKSSKLSKFFSRFTASNDENNENCLMSMPEISEGIFIEKENFIDFLMILIQLLKPKDTKSLIIFDSLIKMYKNDKSMQNYFYMQKFQAICRFGSHMEIYETFLSIKKKISGLESHVLMNCLLVEKFLSYESLSECEIKMLKDLYKGFNSLGKMKRFFGNNLLKKCMSRLEDLIKNPK